MSRSTVRTRLAALSTAVLVAGGLAAASPALAAPKSGSGSGGQIDYVSLGDSYTASPFNTPPVSNPPGCYQSATNYPRLVAADLGASLTDVSCSGATTQDFSSPQTTDAGVNPPQYDALSKQADLVSVGIGGNDIGFSGIITQCLQLTAANAASSSPSPSPCKDFYTAGGVDQLRQRIDATAPKIANVITTVHARTSARTPMLLVGYPAILPEQYILTCADSVPYTPGDIDYLRGIEKYLNAMLATQAGQAKSTSYVDTYTSSIGHDACQVPTVKWVEGIDPQAPAYPVHPNALGQQNSYRQVMATLGR